MRAADRLHSRLGKAEALHLPLSNQVFHRSRHVFDRHRRVDAVLIIEIDRVNFKPLERALGALLDAGGTAIDNLLSVGIGFNPELGGYRDFPSERSEAFAHELFVRERAVHFGRVEECDAALDSRAKKSDHLLLLPGRTADRCAQCR
jgi:hypothetical protein